MAADKLDDGESQRSIDQLSNIVGMVGHRVRKKVEDDQLADSGSAGTDERESDP